MIIGRTVRAAALFSAVSLTCSVAMAEPLFRVHRKVPGVTYMNVCGAREQIPIIEQNGQGIGVLDYDGDGLMDLFVPNGSTESRWRARDNPGCRLYRNLGGWRFADVTEAAGVRGRAWSCGVAVADYDGDGDPDIYVLNWGSNVLYRNDGDGTFTDVTDVAGVGDARWSSSAAFADFNGDGLLDIYVSNYVRFDYDAYPTSEKDGKPCMYRAVETGCGPWCYDGERDTLYINVGGGRFEDRSTSSGLAVTAGYRGFGVVAADFDDDKDIDVYVGCDVMPNLYLENVGGGRFRSAGEERGGVLNDQGAHESGMGVAVADYDRNGTLDVFVTNFAGESNTFYRNDQGQFVDATSVIGLGRHRIEMGWGVVAKDFNQDGLADVLVVNGHIYPQVDSLNDPQDRYAHWPRLFLQGERGRLAEVPSAKAFAGVTAASLRGCAAVDLDNDGDLDIVAVRHNGPLLFFENLSNRAALVVTLVDEAGGVSPMGARVSVGGGPSQWLLPNQGYQSSQDPRLFFPMAPAKQPVVVEVTWVDGHRQTYSLDAGHRGVVRLQRTARAAAHPILGGVPKP